MLTVRQEEFQRPREKGSKRVKKKKKGQAVCFVQYHRPCYLCVLFLCNLTVIITRVFRLCGLSEKLNKTVCTVFYLPFVCAASLMVIVGYGGNRNDGSLY